MKSNLTPQHDSYVIGIGFSAGGLDPLMDFFDHTPLDSASYIIIQHLPYDYKSDLLKILSKHSKLKIFEIEDNMQVEKNCIYLMPERKSIIIKKGKLHLSNSDKQPNTPIDTFLDSLASDKGSKSIGVILSGNGSDGTKGIEAIKKAGGLVIVQNPDDAEYDGMPNSAIESGNANLILHSNQMPGEISKYLEQITLLSRITDKISADDELALTEILEMIKTNTPLDFTNYKRPTIIRRIIRRMVQYNIYSMRDYIDLLKQKPLEIDALSKEFLISVTKFFRDPKAFEVIRKKVIPSIVEHKLIADPLKIWIIGCATGEEAYSIAILLKEYLTEIKKDFEVKIFATDIDKDAIAVASRGTYSLSITEDVSEERLNKYFILEEGKYRISEQIRKMVIFARHDLIKQPPYAKLDLISCRNLFIYFDPVLQRKIFTTLHFCLNLNGYLFLGPSESIGGLRPYFEEIDEAWKIFRNIEAARSIGSGIYTAPGYEIKRNHIRSAISSSFHKNHAPDSYTESINQALVKYSGYSGVCVDDNYKITQPFGDFKKYLLPEMFSLNLLKMVPEELSIALGTALREVLKSNKGVAIKDIKFKDGSKLRSVNIIVIPLDDKNKGSKNKIVLFSEQHREKQHGENQQVFDKDKHTTRYLADLEEELNDVKRSLQEAYEALEISNDNSQSQNEELISSNEEMQSTNEELQSVNEELQTVNNEYQVKIKELAEVNDDMNNFFRSSINGQIYVDTNLIIRKFTPATTKQLNLIESDLGRSLSNISTNIRFDTLMEDIINVISNCTVVEKQVQTKDGKWYQMSIIPYIRKQYANKSDGAIITFNDVTEIKKAQEILIENNAEELKHKNEELTRINNELDNFIYTASHDLKAPIANIEGLVDAMMSHEVYENDDLKFYIDMMNLSIKKFSKTIVELTDITKIQNSIVDDIENSNLNELIEEVKFSLNSLILVNNARIETDFADGLAITFSKRNLRSILYNLMNNAIKYRTKEIDPVIVIKAEQDVKYIKISVKDNGIGISESNMDKLFTMFTRFHDHVEGSGIGLYIVKKMVDNAKGKIEVESEVGKGSTFNLYFPKKA